jgi:hypothetical protein
MKLFHGISVIILAILATSCESKNTSKVETTDNKTSTTNCVFSHCESNVDSKNDLKPKSKATEAPEKKQSVTYKLECRGENNDTGEYILVMVVGEKTRGLLGITTGIPLWGYPYDHKERCEQHKTKTIAGLAAGADGWSSGYKNGYPVVCSSKKGNCLKDSKGEIMEVATFRKNVNAGAMAKKFTNRFSNTKSAYDDLPITSPPSEIIDFNSILENENGGSK